MEAVGGVESFNLWVYALDDPGTSNVAFELLSGSADLRGGIRGFRPKDLHYILEYIHRIFRRSPPPKAFTTLRLDGYAVELLNNGQFSMPYKALPPITHLELVEPVWCSHESSSKEVSEGPVPCIASSFSALRRLVLQGTSPDSILDIVLGVLGDRQRGAHSMSECRVENLDHVEIHIWEEPDLTKAEAVVGILREDSRIGRVDLHVIL
ncbi:hypothetical protein FRC01_003771 [Tulasnella sp. 417]|nr:hypothetical protein FRC01_003771 [Tulasnella sp. 417]